MKLNQNKIRDKIDTALLKVSKNSESFFSVDMGNTHPHIGHYEGATLKEVTPLTQEYFNQIKLKSNWVCSNVTHHKISKNNRLDHLRLKDSFLNMKVDYADTLGEDRLYQAYFLHHLFPKETFTLIDAGTFITVDKIDSAGFRGGYIFPGLRVFLDSYGRGQNLAGNLPLPCDLKLSLPKNTPDAITEASKAYLLGILKTCVNEQSNVILTGGNGKLLADFLERENYFPHLIHDSLFFISHAIVRP